MSIELNHTIVHVKDRWVASRDVGLVLGLPDARAYGPFADDDRYREARANAHAAVDEFLAAHRKRR